jgi:hypothetical protein
MKIVMHGPANAGAVPAGVGSCRHSGQECEHQAAWIASSRHGDILHSCPTRDRSIIGLTTGATQSGRPSECV